MHWCGLRAEVLHAHAIGHPLGKVESSSPIVQSATVAQIWAPLCGELWKECSLSGSPPVPVSPVFSLVFSLVFPTPSPVFFLEFLWDSRLFLRNSCGKIFLPNSFRDILLSSRGVQQKPQFLLRMSENILAEFLPNFLWVISCGFVRFSCCAHVRFSCCLARYVVGMCASLARSLVHKLHPLRLCGVYAEWRKTKEEQLEWLVVRGVRATVRLEEAEQTARWFSLLTERQMEGETT